MSTIFAFYPVFSDITTLTSASYQPSLQMHAGQHLLSIQGERFQYLHNWITSGVIYCRNLYFLPQLMCASWFSFPLSGSPVSHSRSGPLLGERSKQLFPTAVIPVSGIFLFYYNCFWSVTRAAWMVFFSLLFIDTSLSDTKLQLGLCRARPVQWRSGGPRAVRSGSAPAPVHLRTWAFCTCQFCQQFSDQRYRTLWQESIFLGGIKNLFYYCHYSN